MSHWIKHTILRRSLKVLAGLFVVLLLLPFSLYIPWVQQVVKDFACDYASQATGMTIRLDRILLKFPLDLEVEGLSVVEQSGDTMARVETFVGGVELRPLFDLDLKIGDMAMTNGYYHLLTADSSTVVTAQVDFCRLQGTDVDLKHNLMNIN